MSQSLLRAIPDPEANNVAIQRAVDQAAADGGGVVEVPRGVYLLYDSIHLPSRVRLVGQDGAVLRKVPSIAQPLIEHLGYGHYEFSVAEPDAIRVGMGVRISDDSAGGFLETVATIVAREGKTFFIDRPLRYDYYLKHNARVATVFPLISALDAEDVFIENLKIDGNVEETRILGGCRGGGIYLYHCQRVHIENVEATNYRGDGISFQQCADVFVRRCRVHNSAAQGLHPGSGSVRYLLEDNHICHNGGDGLYFCLRTTHSLCRGNRIEGNGGVGISIGERDTDHLICDNFISGNARAAVDFRGDHTMGARRVVLRHNRIGPNCLQAGDAEITVAEGLRNLHVLDNDIAADGHVALRAGAGCRDVAFAGNAVAGRPQGPADIIAPPGSVEVGWPVEQFPAGPAVLPIDGARHLAIPMLPPWRGDRDQLGSQFSKRERST